jgi:hypothetical protein
MTTTIDTLETLTIAEIAALIHADWDPVWFGAVPYLRAMFHLGTLDDAVGYDDGRTIVLYFLSNAKTWKGDTARAVKAELRSRLNA